MAQVLAVDTETAAARGWWPVDLVIAAYVTGVGLLILAFHHKVPGASWLLALHAAALAVLIWGVRANWALAAGPAWVWRHWYSLPYVGLCYREMSILIPAVRGVDLDAAIARLDLALWGTHPAVWLERVHARWFTEILQIVYAAFPIAVLYVAWLFWRKRRLPEFRYYVFLISLGFLVSFVGYLLVPVRGPRFLLSHLQNAPLEGLWAFDRVRRLLDTLESAHYDCFPSGHTELILLAWWTSRQISRNLFLGFSVYTVFMIFSTVYLRYHYTVDLFAGAALAVLLIAAAPRLYAGLRRGR